MVTKVKLEDLTLAQVEEYQKENRIIKCIECDKLHLKKTKMRNCKYCSHACAETYRKKNKFYVEERVCKYCDKKFEASKYKPFRVCSMRCAAKLRYSHTSDQT